MGERLFPLPMPCYIYARFSVTHKLSFDWKLIYYVCSSPCVGSQKFLISFFFSLIGPVVIPKRKILHLDRRKKTIHLIGYKNYTRAQNHSNSRIDIPHPSARETNSSTEAASKAETIFMTSTAP